MKLPPLNAVRAFDAAARRLNLRQAAGDLYVTPGAVSQQVRQLEEWLGVRLFERRARGVALTAAGIEFHAAVARALRQIGQAAERVRPERNAVTVSMLPTLGARWLMPRLDAFTRAHPSVQVSVAATDDVADFEADGVDLAVRCASIEPRGLASIEICAEAVYPVCSAAYRAAHVRRGRLSAGARLLHEVCARQSSRNWARWLEEQGYEDFDAERGLYFSHEMLAADAAASGQGIALLSQLVAADALRAGRLALASPRPLVTGQRYWIVWPPGELREPVRIFRDWLSAAFAQAVDEAREILAAGKPIARPGRPTAPSARPARVRGSAVAGARRSMQRS
ncbi:MAG: LysR family transcriptional regulator [Burkholderiales bacterium]|nr:MAG: LysR family transcriptional regulator [Burkholderiales bacterium]